MIEDVADAIDGAEEPAPEKEKVHKARRSAGSVADALVRLADEAVLFRTRDGTAYADLTIEGHRETWAIDSQGFRDWLMRRYYEREGGAPSGEAMNSATATLAARARFDGAQHDVHGRVGGLGHTLYLDLGDASWRAVEIDAQGWRIVEEPLVRFRRGSGTQALPEPQRGGSVELLRAFLNVRDDHDFTLAVAWLLASLRDRGPYPVLVLSGEQGSAKSTVSQILRTLVDPVTAPLRTLPRDERELFIAAGSGHLQAFDNLSGLPPWMSDALCRLASGAGFAFRKLYTNQDEVVIDAARPVILNGIEDIVTRPDLADRALFLTLEPIAEDRRRPAADLWHAFERARPMLLGVLLDAVSRGLARLPHTSLPKLPRMADFALWATACESALWEKGTFMRAYDANRADAVKNVIEADAVAAAVMALMSMQTAQTVQTAWTGTSTELLAALGRQAGEDVTRRRDWPVSAVQLGNRLRRAATFLRQAGINIEFRRTGRSSTRTITISATPSSQAEEKADSSSAPSASSAEPEGWSETL
jgi:hypothetical protein